MPYADTEAMQFHLNEIAAPGPEERTLSCCSTAPAGTPPAASSSQTT